MSAHEGHHDNGSGNIEEKSTPLLSVREKLRILPSAKLVQSATGLHSIDCTQGELTKKNDNNARQ